MANGLIYKKIMNYLMRAIESGELKVGDAVYSENRLCEKFKASRTSVRKAIREMVDKNLLISRQGLGTFVKSTGHGFINNSICMVNHYTRVLRYDLSDTYYMDIVYGAEEAVNERKINFQLFSSYLGTPENVKEKMSHVNVDGLLIDGKYQDTSDPALFSELSPHVVVVDGNPDETELLSVVPDAEEVYKELLTMHKGMDGKIVFLYDDQSSQNRWKLNCFRRAAKQLKVKNIVYINFGENVMPDNFANIDHYCLVFNSLEKCLKENSDIKSIIAVSDHVAVKTINVLTRKNYVVPDDISVCGFAGMHISTMCNPSLTTCYVDPRQVAGTATDLLINQIQGNIKERVVMVPVRIIKRNSFITNK